MKPSTHKRSLAKAISWRLLSSSVTWIATFTITRSLFYATSLSAFEVLGKVGLFYGHERLWESDFSLRTYWQTFKRSMKKWISFETLSRFPLV